MLSNPAKARPSLLATLLACSALLASCTTSPTSGRTQFNILPAPLEAGVSDLRFSVKTALAAGDYCPDKEGPCPVREAAEQLAQRVAPIAERLALVAPQLSPELVTRVPRVEVFVVPNDSVSVSSSAGGKIAVGSGLAKLDLTDTELALALSREFGRLAAAHHRESTSAGLAVSLVAGSPLVGAYLATSILADLLFPMGSLIKLGISVLGSIGTEQLVEVSQQDEADAFAGKLMLAAGYDLRALAESRADIPEGAVKIGWLPAYVASRALVATMAPPAETIAEANTARDTAPQAASEAALQPGTNEGTDTVREPHPAETAGIAVSLADIAAIAMAHQEPLLVASADVAATPTATLTTAAAANPPSAPAPKAEHAAPAVRTAAPKPQGRQPKAKPAAVKKTPKAAVKKTKPPRRPVKKKTPASPSPGN